MKNKIVLANNFSKAVFDKTAQIKNTEKSNAYKKKENQ